ncbi:hypothetical protein WMY93_014831 [Mugilogobius chulae]|uniref:Uncharacterized protein n=1 Tax=Mugilogobius chulae TaxID=88201 RepID=A0AAW0P2Q0_9GOBI
MESVAFQIEVINVTPSAAVSEPSHEPDVTSDNTLLRPQLWLLLLVTPVALAMTSVLVLLIYKKKRAQNDVELRENSGRSRAEPELYENMRGDDTYQSLCADTMDSNQIYSSI